MLETLRMLMTDKTGTRQVKTTEKTKHHYLFKVHMEQRLVASVLFKDSSNK